MKEAYLTSGSSPGTLDERITTALPAELPAPAPKSWLVVAVGMVQRFTNPEGTWLLAVAPVPPFVIGLPVQQAPARGIRPRRYPRGKGVRGSKQAFRCPPGCMAAYEALRLHNLPWQYAFSVSGPDCLAALDILPIVSGIPSDKVQPFWYYTISDHEGALNPKTWDPRKAVPHVHGIISGVEYEPFVTALRGFDSTVLVKRVVHAFGWLHYMIAQERAIPARDGKPRDISGMLRHFRDIFSYCLALLCPPVPSPNLEGIANYYRDALRAYRARVRPTVLTRTAQSLGGQARARALTPEQRSRIARGAALARRKSSS